MTVVFLPQARSELDDGADWYEDRQIGLGVLFNRAVQAVLSVLTVHPRLYGEVSPRVRRREIRQAPVADFPYTVIYEVRPDELLILAVAHNSLRPYYWRRRLA